MSKEYGYIGKEVTQAFRDNKGIFTPQDIIELDQENKWTNFGQLELIQTQTFTTTQNVDFTSIEENTYNIHFATVLDSPSTTSSTVYKTQMARYDQSGTINVQRNDSGSAGKSTIILIEVAA